MNQVFPPQLFGRRVTEPPRIPQHEAFAPAEARSPPMSPAPAAASTLVIEDRARWDRAWATVLDRLTEMADLLRSATREPDSEESRQRVRAAVTEILEDRTLLLPAAEKDRFTSEMVAEVLGLGPLETLMADETITEIMVNTHREIWVERAGRLEKTPFHLRDEDHARRLAQKMAAGIGREVNTASPFCRARLLNGARIQIVLPPIAIDGTHINIRKFPLKRFTAPELVARGLLTEEAWEFLEIAVRARQNILVSGGMGAGKTTLLNSMGAGFGAGERILLCEDPAELKFDHGHTIRLETRPPSSEGGGLVSFKDIVDVSLRMRPDRVCVGEVSGAEALYLLQAMSIGQPGSLGTIHANNPRKALGRLETCIRRNTEYQTVPARNIREEIANAVDLIVQVRRLRDGKRVVTAICEVEDDLEDDRITLIDTFKYDFRLERLVVPQLYQPRMLDAAEEIGEATRLLRVLEKAHRS